MPLVEFYNKDYCPYCVKAKALLTQLDVAFTEIDISRTPDKLAELQARKPGVRTLPQIFIGGQSIGGCDDLYALFESGNLKPMLGL
ncbi:MAG: glutaredoxin 3 [Alphaproteobacteria bacterium]